MTAGRRDLRPAVIRQVNAAVNAKLSEANARRCFELICPNSADVDRAMELFRRWIQPASVPASGSEG